MKKKATAPLAAKPAPRSRVAEQKAAPVSMDPPAPTVMAAPVRTRPAARWVAPVAGTVWLILCLVPVFIYYRMVYLNAVDVPFEDDFDSTLRFMSTYLSPANSLLDRLKLIFSQHNEHRIVLDRLFFVGQHYLLGHIDLRGCILFGNLSLLFIAALLFAGTFRRESWPVRLLYLLPVAWILFQFHFWELTVWGMASIQNLYVVVFALLSFYALDRSKSHPAWFHVAYLAAGAAVFTSGNGLFVFITGVLVLLLQKRYRQAAIWTGAGAVFITLYFWGYARSGTNPSAYTILVENTSRSVDYFFTLTGSIFSASPAYPIRAGKAFLLLFIGLTTYLALTKRLTNYLPIVSLLFFLYLTAFALVLTRSGNGVVQALSPRYGIIPVLIFSGVLILAIETATRRYVKGAVFLAALGVSLYSYVSSFDLNKFRIEDRARLLRYSAALYNDNKANLVLYYPDAARAKTIFTDAAAKHIYQMPPTTLNDLKSQPAPFTTTPLIATNDITADVKPFVTPDFLIMYQAYALLNGVASDNVKTEVLAQSAAGTYAFATGPHIRYDVVNQLQSMDYLGAGFSCVIRKKDLKPGKYALWLHLTTGSGDSFFPINGVLEV